MLFARGCLRPQLCTHSPGISLKIADSLSRRFQPGVAWTPPLPEALEQQPPEVNADFFEVAALVNETLNRATHEGAQQASADQPAEQTE